jgi:hypothetical protein
MRSKLVYFFAGALVAVISSAATRAVDAQRAIKKGTLVNLSAEDYLEIMQLQNYYPRDVDPGSKRNGAWKFTRDARALVQPGRPMTKPADFEEFFAGFIGPDGQANKGGSRHFNTTPIIIGLPDGTARGAVMMLSINIPEKGGKPVLDGMGVYDDLYVKTPDGWRIKERNWKRDTFVGSYQKRLPPPILGDPSTYSTHVEEAIKENSAPPKP